MVVGFPFAVAFEFQCRNVVEVDYWHIEFLAQSLDPRSERGQLALYACRVVGFVVIAWGESEEDRGGTLCTNLVDETACVATKRVYSLSLSCLFHSHGDGVVRQRRLTVIAFVTCACPARVERSVVVMS